MKTLSTRIWIAAAAVVVTAGIASAQDRLRAEIPFTFQAGHHVLPAGTYEIGRPVGSLGERTFQFTNRNDRTSVLVMTVSPMVSEDSQSNPRLVFQCGETRCVLDQVWQRGTASGYQLVHMRTPREKETRRVAIHLTSAAE